MHYETVEDLADSLLKSLSKRRVALIYAPNAVGKTRLAQHLKDSDPEGVILYNAFVEDVFTWDNKRVVLKMNLEYDLLKTIEEQGLDGEIVRTFQGFTHDRIEPTLDLANGDTRFGIHKGDNTSLDGVKISRAEESIFVWSVYYSILSDAIDTLADSRDLRSTTDYDALSLAVIDDPVSSMDDVRIVGVALALTDLIKRASDLDLKFVVTTHHALFFNVLHSSIERMKGTKSYILQRGVDTGWLLKDQQNGSPFSYHLEMIGDIERAISNNAIRRIHFNQFRTILEKTASFLGYGTGWGRLLSGPKAAELTRILNLYSHDQLADPDPSEVYEEYKDALAVEFHQFLKEFKWGITV